jgi:hypothetical protein
MVQGLLYGQRHRDRENNNPNPQTERIRLMRGIKILTIALLGILCSACSVTRKLSEGEYFLQRVEIEDDKQTPKK